MFWVSRAAIVVLENVNALIVLAGFVALEAGLAARTSPAVAAIVGGGVLMVGGSWRYLAGSLRKRT